MARRKLGALLLERGIIDQDQLNSALAYQRQWGHRLGVALVALGFITEGMLVKVLGEVMGLPVVDLSQVSFDVEALRTMPHNICENNDLIPIRKKPGRGKDVLVVAMADPMNLAIVDEIEFTSGCTVQTVLAPTSAINSAIQKYYRGQNTTIKPMRLYQDKADDTGRMVLVRPGGLAEEVDTSTYQNAEERSAANDVRERMPRNEKRQPKQASREAERMPAAQAMGDYLQEVQIADLESLEKLEKYFWALMRVLAKKGVITKDEFLREMNQ